MAPYCTWSESGFLACSGVMRLPFLGLTYFWRLSQSLPISHFLLQLLSCSEFWEILKGDSEPIWVLFRSPHLWASLPLVHSSGKVRGIIKLREDFWGLGAYTGLGRLWGSHLLEKEAPFPVPYSPLLGYRCSRWLCVLIGHSSPLLVLP